MCNFPQIHHNFYAFIFFSDKSLDIDGRHSHGSEERIGVIMIWLIGGNHGACFVKSESLLSLTMFQEAFEP